MKVSYPIPAEKISDVVEGMLVIENDSVRGPYTLPLYANGKPTLLFQTTKGKIKDNENHLTLFGQTILPDKITMTGNFTLIAYFLRPIALTTLFDIPAHELTDKPVSLELLRPQHTRGLLEQLLHAASTSEMIRTLNGFIFHFLTKVQVATNMIGHATTLIAENPSKEILVRVQDELCITERTFQRMFERNVGVSPNQYRRIVQFNTAFQQLNGRQFKLFTDVAFNNNYSDQSHFTRAFKEFTNLTPKEYMRFRLTK